MQGQHQLSQPLAGLGINAGCVLAATGLAQRQHHSQPMLQLGTALIRRLDRKAAVNRVDAWHKLLILADVFDIRPCANNPRPGVIPCLRCCLKPGDHIQFEGRETPVSPRQAHANPRKLSSVTWRGEKLDHVSLFPDWASPEIT